MLAPPHQYLFKGLQHLSSLTEVFEDELQRPGHQRCVVLHDEMNENPQKHAATFIVQLNRSQLRAENTEVHVVSAVCARLRKGKQLVNFQAHLDLYLPANMLSAFAAISSMSGSEAESKGIKSQHNVENFNT